MMSAEQARALVSAADRQKARLLLIGDRQQLPAIEAGRPFAMLLERGMQFTEMRQVKRQTDPALRAAVRDSIARREAAALKKLSGHTSSYILSQTLQGPPNHPKTVAKTLRWSNSC